MNDVLTSAGLAAGIDLCVQIVRADYGICRIADAPNQGRSGAWAASTGTSASHW